MPAASWASNPLSKTPKTGKGTAPRASLNPRIALSSGAGACANRSRNASNVSTASTIWRNASSLSAKRSGASRRSATAAARLARAVCTSDKAASICSTAPDCKRDKVAICSNSCRNAIASAASAGVTSASTIPARAEATGPLGCIKPTGLGSAAIRCMAINSPDNSALSVSKRDSIALCASAARRTASRRVNKPCS